MLESDMTRLWSSGNLQAKDDAGLLVDAQMDSQSFRDLVSVMQ